MKIFASGTRSLRGPRRTLALSVLLALPRVPAALAQPQAPETDGEDQSKFEQKTELPWQAHGKFDPVLFMGPFTTHIILHKDAVAGAQFVYFPPVAPPLESEIPVLAPFDPGPPAPEELDAFVAELFYPLLGARLVSGDLPRPLRAKIVAYRNAKVVLQEEIRSHVLALKDVDPETRERQLESLAELQATRISGLEATAEKLREDLRPGRAFGVQTGSADPIENLARRVRPVRDTPSDPAELRKEAEAIRAAAFYEEGLSPDQRRLLVEAAAEIETRTDSVQTAPATRLLFFSPETSRIPIPPSVASPLEEKINEYLSIKDLLKAELRDSLGATSGASADARTAAMVALAGSQAPRFARLESLAEEIRRGMAALPNPPGPTAAPALPPDLSLRISEYRKHKLELLKTLRDMLAAPTPVNAASGRPTNLKPTDVGAGTLAWMHDGSTTTEIQSSNLRVSVAEFDQRQNALIAALNTEEAGIRESLAAFVRTSNGPSDRKSVNDLLRDFEEARQRQELWDRYRDYQAAALLPGLSAGQRRLIFDAAVEELSLPLPVGDRVN